MRLRDSPGIGGVLVLDPEPSLLPKGILVQAMGELRALVAERTQVSPSHASPRHGSKSGQSLLTPASLLLPERT
jgi:hypothetical protein